MKNYYESVESLIDDSTSEYMWDDSIRTKTTSLITHNMSVNAPQKLFKYISLNPSIQFKSDWVDRTYSLLDSSNGQIESIEKYGFAARTIFSSHIKIIL